MRKQQILRLIKNLKKISLVIIILITAIACSTSKDKWQNRQYHRLTTKYNVLFNARTSLKEANNTIKTNFKDDYTQIIPVFVQPDENLSKSIKSNCDRTIEKSSKAIKKHSMRIAGKERNSQIDDAYILIGRACLLNNDFKGAEAAFKFVISNWKNEKVSFEAMTWLALTYCKSNKYAECELILKEIEKGYQNKKADKSIRDFMLLVKAENDIKQGKLYPALEDFSIRKKHWFDKSQNVRNKFIQGQIYMQLEEYDKAYKCFGYTYRHAKDYNLQFVSKLNQALCTSDKGYKSIKVINQLEDMLDKPVNKEYQDQILYAIGEIYYKNNNLQTAVKKWQQSSAVSVNNNTQKLASCLKVADVSYYQTEDFITAYNYYDTALNLMSGLSNPKYASIKDKQRVLESLVKNLNTIQKWDSLMALSELSKDELDKKINKWISDYKTQQELEKAKQELEQAITQRNSQINNFNQNQQNNRSAFYFYNPQTVDAGKSEFKRKWGNRILEDNWRREQKEAIGFENEDLAENNENENDSNKEKDQQSSGLTPLNKEYYTKDIPYTQADKDKANEQTANAMLDAGYIYWQGLNKIDKSIEMFLELHRRYPNHKNIVPSSYHLYKEYELVGNYPSSNYYKTKILNEYPQSEFAMMLENPQYWENNSEGHNLQDSLYNVAYTYYNNKEFLSAINSSEQSINQIKTGDYIPKLQYVSALAKGKLYGIDSLSHNLNMIVFNYPNSEISPIIESQLQYLKETYNIKDFDIRYDSIREKQYANSTSQQINDDIINELTENELEKAVNRDDILDSETLVFKYKDGRHYFVILADDSKLDADAIQENINTYNENFFNTNNLTSTTNLFTTNYQIITVKQFSNIDQAFVYYDSINNNTILQSLNNNYFKCFIISMQNYATLYAKRNIDAYIKFFRIMYLNNRDKSE